MFIGYAILFGLLAQLALIWAANIGEVVAGTQGLANIAQEADEDVKAITRSSGKTEASV